MIKSIHIIITLFLAITVGAQIPEKSGIRILTNETLTDSQLEQILNFNYEKYRKDEESVIVQIINGPTLELFGRKGTIQPKVEVSNNVNKNSSHDHLTPSEVEVRKIKIIQINLFHTQENEPN